MIYHADMYLCPGALDAIENATALEKKAAEATERAAKAQEELGDIEVEGQSGGGMITAFVNGKKELLSLKIEVIWKH